MTSFRLSVPGNLLLAGEYAILEEGGLGAAIAVEPRLWVTVEPASFWEVTGIWPGGGEVWTPERGTDSFTGKLFEGALKALNLGGDLPPARIALDSTSFYSRDGRKLGLGSSAAAACGLTAALAVLGNRTESHGRFDPAIAHQPAVSAHRWAQGGSGSGYDVTASCFGGYGLFTGGEKPAWAALDSGIFPLLTLFQGPKAVRTTSSIAAYEKAKAEDPDGARTFRKRSDSAVKNITQARSWDAAVQAWVVCRDLGVAWGRQIGVEASLDLPPSLLGPNRRFFCKALGAGNETGLVAGEASLFPDPLPEGLTKLMLATEGLRWE